MNYRHIYHAGNICDVVKHAVLTLLLQQLASKDKPFSVIDTHAGIGLYDLHDERALKTNEAEDGILRLQSAPPLDELASYYQIIKQLNDNHTWQLYPGSPQIVKSLLRAEDRLTACELHPEDVRQLKQHFRNDAQVQIHHRDGYEALRALLPPEPKRGLAIIDPPYETGADFDQLVSALQQAHKVWSIGQFLVWYPIKERPALWHWHEALIKTAIPKILCAEFIYQPELRSDRLNGSGFILVNPPWQFDQELRIIFQKLHRALGTTYQNDQIKWLTAE